MLKTRTALNIFVLAVLLTCGSGSRSVSLKSKLDRETVKPSALCRACRTQESCTERPATCLECPICSSFVNKLKLEVERSDKCPSLWTRKLCDFAETGCGPHRCKTLCAPKKSKKSTQNAWKPVEELMVELENLVGLGDVKDQMKEIVAQVDFNLQRANLGLPDIGGQSLHMSFLGNPGTGKTVVARIVGQLLVAMGAIKSDSTEREGDLVSEVSRPDLVGEHSGSTALKVTKAFDDCRWRSSFHWWSIFYCARGSWFIWQRGSRHNHQAYGGQAWPYHSHSRWIPKRDVRLCSCKSRLQVSHSIQLQLSRLHLPWAGDDFRSLAEEEECRPHNRWIFLWLRKSTRLLSLAEKCHQIADWLLWNSWLR